MEKDNFVSLSGLTSDSSQSKVANQSVKATALLTGDQTAAPETVVDELEPKWEKERRSDECSRDQVDSKTPAEGGVESGETSEQDASATIQSLEVRENILGRDAHDSSGQANEDRHQDDSPALGASCWLRCFGKGHRYTNLTYANFKCQTLTFAPLQEEINFEPQEKCKVRVTRQFCKEASKILKNL